MNDEDVLTCTDCGATVLRRSPNQMYCPECSGKRDTERKAGWAKRNPQTPRPDAYARQRSAVVAGGVERSVDNRVGIAWMDGVSDDDFRQLVRVAIPFDWAASKNAVWRNGRGGHVYARAEGVAVREQLASKIKHAGGEWFQGKVWIDIFVEKPNHRGDATNVVDLVCDAVKDAIGVDDRWYSLRRVDWAIVKTDPKIYVGVAQAVDEHHQACSHCGRVLTLDEFGSNRSTKTGRSRVCRDCSAPVRGRKVAA